MFMAEQVGNIDLFSFQNINSLKEVRNTAETKTTFVHACMYVLKLVKIKLHLDSFFGSVQNSSFYLPNLFIADTLHQILIL